MSYIETSDILIRDMNKKYLQINYDLDGVIKIIAVDIIIDGNEYNSTYYNFNCAFFDLSFINNNSVYECNVRIKFIANDTYIVDNYGNELMTDNGQYIVVNRLSSSNDVFCVYGNIDEELKVAYIGLTVNKQLRHLTHSTGKFSTHKESKSPVYDYFSSRIETEVIRMKNYNFKDNFLTGTMSRKSTN